MLDLTFAIIRFAAPKLGTLVLLLLSIILLLVGMYCRFWLRFNLLINIRYGVFGFSFDDIPVFAIDILGGLSDNVIIIQSPFGWS